MMRKTRVLLFSAVLLAAGCSSIPARAWRAPITYNVYLREQGLFVRYPTAFGTVVGLPASVIVLPLMPLLEPETGEGAGWGLFLLGPSIVGDVVGTPFLAIRRALWDLPRWWLGARGRSSIPDLAPEPAHGGGKVRSPTP